MSIWVYTRPHYFYYPSPDFTTSIVSQLVTNNRSAPSWGGHKRKVRGHIKKFSAGASRRHCAPTWKLLPTPLQSTAESSEPQQWHRPRSVPRTFSVLAAIFQVHLAQPVYTMQNISNFGFHRSCRWWRWWVVAGCPSCHPTNSVKTLKERRLVAFNWINELI